MRFRNSYPNSLLSSATTSLGSRKKAETSGLGSIVNPPIDARSMTSRMSCTRNMKSKQAPWLRHESSRIVAAWQEVKERESQTHAIGALRAASLERSGSRLLEARPAERGREHVGKPKRDGEGDRWYSPAAVERVQCRS